MAVNSGLLLDFYEKVLGMRQDPIIEMSGVRGANRK